MSAAAARLLLGLHAGAAFAHEQRYAPPAAAREPPILEEILVTAQRREERSQDVPISLSVFPGEELERQQIDDVSTLQYLAPNLTIAPFPGSQTSSSIAMRGHLEPDSMPTVDPAVAVYLDGVYIARKEGANLDLIDMERVEVLRGPQGTLFGRNTIGGAINLVPRRPSFNFEGAVTAGAGNYDLRDLTLIANAPLASDRCALRLSASHREHGGYGRNILLGRDLNGDDTYFARTQLRLMPADRWDVNLSFDFTRVNTARNLLTLLAVFPPLTAVPAATGNPDDHLENYENPTARSVQANRFGVADEEVWGASGTLTIEFARSTFKSISAYRTHDSGNRDLDLDGTPYDLLAILDRHDRQHQVSQELQAYGEALDQRLGWIGGLYYFDESAAVDQRARSVQPISLRAVDNEPRGTVHNDSIAAYAQLRYAITPKLRATGGVRYNVDGRQLTSRTARVSGGIETCALDPAVRDEPGVCQAARPERRFSYVPYTIGIDFRPNDAALLYAKVSRGYRAGGYNIRGTTEIDLETFEPEEVTAYEVGAKADMLDHRLRLDLAWYWSLFDDIQSRLAVAIPGALLSLPVTENVGEARIKGGELEVTALLGAFRLSGALGITHAKYTKLAPRVLDLTLDSRFLATPETTAAIAADLPIAVDFGGIDLHADYSWRDDVPFAYAPSSLARQDAYGLLNAALIARFRQGHLELKLWGRNLTDRRYVARASDSRFLVTAIPGDPRTYGASFTYRFGVD